MEVEKIKITVKSLIETLEKLNDEDKNKVIISISTFSGFDRPCEYAIRLDDYSEIMIGKRD